MVRDFYLQELLNELQWCVFNKRRNETSETVVNGSRMCNYLFLLVSSENTGHFVLCSCFLIRGIKAVGPWTSFTTQALILTFSYPNGVAAILIYCCFPEATHSHLQACTWTPLCLKHYPQAYFYLAIFFSCFRAQFRLWYCRDASHVPFPSNMLRFCSKDR